MVRKCSTNIYISHINPFTINIPNKMNFIKTIALLGAFVGLTAGAQQVNGSFDQDWVTCTPWTGGNATHVQGTQPVDWCAANVAGMNFFGWKGQTTVVAQETGRGGTGYAVTMTNTPNSYMASQIVPGYLTLGTTWSTAKGVGSNADGGSWGGKAFSYKPDAVHFYFKRPESAAGNNASLIGYLWKGTYLQESVPCNIAFGTPATCTMEDRDRVILDKATSQGGSVTQTGTLIAKMEAAITATADDWTEMTVPFEYLTDDTPEKLNLIFSAGDYFNATVVSGLSLTIDDVTLVYYHELGELTYDGETLDLATAASAAGLNMGARQYDPAKLAYSIVGKGATATADFDALSGALCITVKGNDYNVNSDSKTVYTLFFAPGTVDPDPTPDPDEEVLPLGAPLADLSAIRNNKAYVLYNPTFTAYAVYSPEKSETNLWVANMTDGDANHLVKDDSYRLSLDTLSANSSWMVVPFNGKYYLYNIGAKKFLVTPASREDPAICKLTDTVQGLDMTQLEEGIFALNTTGNAQGFMCAAPQLDYPVSIWTSSDSGSRWQLMVNPNVEADLSVLSLIDSSLTPSPDDLDAPVSTLEEVGIDATYAIYNPTFTTYLNHSAEHSGSDAYVWAAGMTGNNGVSVANDSYATALDPASPNGAWMIAEVSGLYYFYNMGAQQFLYVPNYEGVTMPVIFTDEVVGFGVEALDEALFAISGGTHTYSYLCAAPQMTAYPLSIWEKTDGGACWQFKRNPNVAADPAVLERIYTSTGIHSATAAPALRKGIYTLNGVYVGREATGLPKGVYIIDGRKVVK